MKKKPNKKTPKVIYAAFVELGGEVGLAKCEWDKIDGRWYGAIDGYPIEAFKLGWEDNGTSIQFSSTSKDEVERWLCGVRDVMMLMHRWARPNNPDKNR